MRKKILRIYYKNNTLGYVYLFKNTPNKPKDIALQISEKD